MSKIYNFIIILTFLFFSKTPLAKNQLTQTYKKFVDGNGNISLPVNFSQEWTFIGTWMVANKSNEESGIAGLHNVYTQPEVVTYYQKHQTFPDGAIFIKELLAGTTKPMTTGMISFAGEEEGWFVMVKDTKGRFKGNPLWGDGWGWALFKPNNKNVAVTKDYKSECLGCHIPAMKNDWIYTEGYPLFKHGNAH